MKVSVTDIHKQKNRLAMNSLNNRPPEYTKVHDNTLKRLKIRNENICIRKIYTVDVFPNYFNIHQ